MIEPVSIVGVEDMKTIDERKRTVRRNASDMLSPSVAKSANRAHSSRHRMGTEREHKSAELREPPIIIVLPEPNEIIDADLLLASRSSPAPSWSKTFK